MNVIGKEHVSYFFDAEIPPALAVDSGETVCFQTWDCYEGEIDEDNKDASLLELKSGNPVTGPLFVNSAEPGDVLKVEILDIACDEWAKMYVREGHGAYQVEGAHCRVFPIRDNKVILDQGIEIPVRPMIGVVGTCPPKPCNTSAPGDHGGNLDIKDLGIGSTIYLPVYVPGALLFLGDCHALQGDGETASCGAEMGACVTVRVTILKDTVDLPTPLIATDTSIITTGEDLSLDIACAKAAGKMHRYLMKASSLTDVQAAILLSLEGDLRISQIVNPLKGCVMELPKRYLTVNHDTL